MGGFGRRKKLKASNSPEGFDLIGDIHGQAPELRALLHKLGYTERAGVWRHKDRRVIFLGDFIDRGSWQRETVAIARNMVEEGSALAVMGNHEYNAIAYFTEDGHGGHLRARTEKNRNQHQAFLDEFEEDTAAWSDIISWFQTLPLWLDLDGLRVVHACWDSVLISKILEQQNGSTLLDETLLRESSIKGSWQYEAIETLLKGKEVRLPGDQSFHDKDGNPRHKIRVRWWDQSARTYREAFMGPDSAVTHIPDDPIEGDHLLEYGPSEKPVILGHYWMEGDPVPLAQNIACVDYSVAKPGGKLVAYRWDGECEIDQSKFVWVERPSAAE
jgi:hypothetical protein